MDEKNRTKLSRFLCYVLRHHPEEFGLTLEPGGWVGIDDLLDACKKAKQPITFNQLCEIVVLCEKQRFSFDNKYEKVRANQGHSTEIDLQLTPEIPPDVLYHGTTAVALQSIISQGIKKGNRHHVHLSQDTSTAKKVSSRHGTPVILKIDAKRMHKDGLIFFCSENGVWLTDFVPPQYLIIRLTEPERALKQSGNA